MKVQTFEGTNERQVLIGMVVSRRVLGVISNHWQPPMFKSQWSNLVGEWCVEFYNKYRKAPKQAIESLFQQWAKGKGSEETITLVERFLSSLSGEYEERAKRLNPEHLIDLASKHFSLVRLRTLIEDTQEDIDIDDFEAAEAKVDGFVKVNLGDGAWVDPFTDEEAIRNAFETIEQPLITFQGAAGRFFKHYLEREGFIALEGAEKAGKSRLALDLAYRAVLQRRKVAFFEVGDMTQKQLLRRFSSRMSASPLRPCTIQYPKKIFMERGEVQATVEHEERVFKKPLDWRAVLQEGKRQLTEKVKTKRSLLRVSCHGSGSISASGIRSILDNWAQQDWVADIVVVDYADLLAPEYSKDDERVAINKTWMALRRLSQELHCLLIAPTQAKAEAYDAKILTKKHFSGNKLKLAHVTGMIGINQTSEEKTQGITRLNWIVLRDGDFNERKCVHLVGCAAIGNPCIRSTY